MIAYLQTKIAAVTRPEEQRSIVREYLQMRILQSMQDAGAMITLAFHGGTALRVLYDLPRYSEDLDFALERQREQYDFRKYLVRIQSDLTADTYRLPFWPASCMPSSSVNMSRDVTGLISTGICARPTGHNPISKCLIRLSDNLAGPKVR